MVTVKILQSKPQKRGDLICYDVRFQIGGEVIGETISLVYWDIDKYIYQWQDGIKRIQVFDTSCLMVSVEQKRTIGQDEYDSVLRWLVLYKKNEKVFIQRVYFHDKAYDNYIGENTDITVNNCYEYIPNYSQYYPISGDYPQVFWELSEEDFDKKFSIKITDENIHPSWYCPVVSGAITIGDYVDEFKMGVSVWSIDDYKQQWKEAIERLQNYSSTCLITDVSESKGDIGRWLLYKRDGKIVFYHASFRGVSYQENIGEEVLTKENCYDFIPDEQAHLEKYRVKEWEVDLKEFDGLEIVWPEK